MHQLGFQYKALFFGVFTVRSINEKSYAKLHKEYTPRDSSNRPVQLLKQSADFVSQWRSTAQRSYWDEYPGR